MLTVAQLKAELAARGLRLTKRLGQHHLVDEASIRRIIAECGSLGRDTVVEIGPGLGALTDVLAGEAARVIAVEVDRGIAAALAERMAGRSNVEVTCEDILQFPWASVPGAVVVGAIPYHITSPILIGLFEARAVFARAVLVMQDEVAQRLAAAPGSKAYGRLSVLAQFGWEVRLGPRVARTSFYPQPAVDSRCVALLPGARPSLNVANESLFFEVVKAGFSQRRKTLANALATLPQAGALGRDGLARLLAQAGLPASVRAEALPLEAFARLTALLGGE
jgi:16S rRNA (adenine1518-N6/adenine1519-N6)-dimethyltransferase